MTESVLVVFGSPHPEGHTARLVDALTGALPDSVVVKRIDCFARMPHPCIDCGVCRREPKCRFDDLDDYYALLETARALVFAAPVYNLSFPAPMKALIDRGQRYWSARFVRGVPAAQRRNTVLLTSAGSERPLPDGGCAGKFLEYQLAPALSVLDARLTAAVHYCGADRDADMSDCMALARGAGLALV